MNIHGSPTDQWFNYAIKEGPQSEDVDRMLEGSVAANLVRIRQIAPEAGREWKKARMVMGIDAHDQMHYDKNPRA